MKNSSLFSIYSHFGTSTQLAKLSEECGELKDAISISLEVYQGNSEMAITTPSVITEMADVTVMLAQFKITMPQLWAQVEAEAERKVARTIERIDSGFYEDPE